MLMVDKHAHTHAHTHARTHAERRLQAIAVTGVQTEAWPSQAPVALRLLTCSGVGEHQRNHRSKPTLFVSAHTLTGAFAPPPVCPMRGGHVRSLRRLVHLTPDGRQRPPTPPGVIAARPRSDALDLSDLKSRFHFSDRRKIKGGSA